MFTVGHERMRKYRHSLAEDGEGKVFGFRVIEVRFEGLLKYRSRCLRDREVKLILVYKGQASNHKPPYQECPNWQTTERPKNYMRHKTNITL